MLLPLAKEGEFTPVSISSLIGNDQLCQEGLIGTLYGDRLPTIVGRKNLLEILNLRNVVDHDVRKLWVLDEKVLMIVFRRIKAFERINPRDDGASEYPGFIQLRYVCLCDPFL